MCDFMLLGTLVLFSVSIRCSTATAQLTTPFSLTHLYVFAWLSYVTVPVYLHSTIILAC
jgi:hypothetical protein